MPTTRSSPKPANKNLKHEDEPKPRRQPKNQGVRSGDSASMFPGLPAGSPVKKATDEKATEEKEKCNLVVTELPKRLWVASTAYGSRERVWHQVEEAGWDVPIETWTSVCGWPFSRNSSKVILNSQLTIAQRKCKKCLRRTCGTAKEDEWASSG